MITCDRCKTENLEGSQYCDECGAPLRPNLRQSISDTAGLHPEADGQNGSRAPVPSQKPEFASGPAAAAFSLSSSLNSSPKPHSRLVIERGRSVGKQFMLNDVEAQ